MRMQGSGLSHIQFNVSPENVPFYDELFTFLSWNKEYEAEGVVGFSGKNGESVWFTGPVKEVDNDYDGPGMNHLAIDAAAQADVDEAAAFLTGKGVEMLFETPRHRPEFSGEDNTYYQIMFESPDRILLEFVYTGPMQD
jgi:catechol 2,3-dioxygenase-like lactoylglutathione lyase family enzyme